MIKLEQYSDFCRIMENPGDAYERAMRLKFRLLLKFAKGLCHKESVVVKEVKYKRKTLSQKRQEYIEDGERLANELRNSGVPEDDISRFMSDWNSKEPT